MDRGLWVWQHYTALTSQHPPMSSPRLSRSVNQSRLTMPISLSWKGRGTDIRLAMSGCFNACVCVCVHKYWLIAPVHGCLMWSDWLPTGDSLWEGSLWHMACMQTNVYGAGTEKKKKQVWIHATENVLWVKCDMYTMYEKYVSGSIVFERFSDQTCSTKLWRRWSNQSMYEEK